MTSGKRKITLTPKAAEAAASKKARTSKTKGDNADLDPGTVPVEMLGTVEPARAVPAASSVPVPSAKAAAPHDDHRARVEDVPDEETAEEELGESRVLYPS